MIATAGVRRVLLNIRTPMNYVMMRPIHEAMKDDPAVEFFFTSSHEPNRRCRLYKQTGDALVQVPRFAARRLQFDAYLSADAAMRIDPPGRARSVQIFHGVGGKYANEYDSPTRSMRDWDRLFFINELRLRNFAASGAIDVNSPAARLVGMPKVDCLVDGRLERGAILRSLGLDPAKPSVLYAPTWSRYSSLEVMGEAVIRALLAAGFTVLVKLHDRAWLPASRMRWLRRRISGDWPRVIAKMLPQGQRHLATAGDSCPYLAAADVMVTDHSSVAFEYMLLDRPIVRLELPALIEQTRTGQRYVDLLSQASRTITAADKVVSAVEEQLANPAELSETRNAVAAMLFHEPGTATARAVTELYELLELEPAERRRTAVAAL